MDDQSKGRNCTGSSSSAGGARTWRFVRLTLLQPWQKDYDKLWTRTQRQASTTVEIIPQYVQWTTTKTTRRSLPPPSSKSPKATKKSGLNYGGIKARFEEAQKNATLLSVTTVPLITHPCLVLSERQTVFNGSFVRWSVRVQELTDTVRG